MGWNGSDRKSHEECVVQRPVKKNWLSYRLGGFAICGVIIAGLALVFSLDTESQVSAGRTEGSTLARNTGHRPRKSRGGSFIAKQEAVKTSAVEKPEIKDAEVIFKPKVQGRVVIWKIANPPVFTNRFEGYIADILTAEPGERFLDTDDLDDDFDEAFKESLKHDIVIDPNDTEDVKALKKAVIASKEEVRQLVAKGDRPRDIVMDARDEMNKIADYRDQVQEAFNKYLLTETDPKQIVKYEQEANALLDEYGAYHIDGPHDEETAYEMMVSTKEEKVQELTEQLEKEDKEK